MPKVSRRKHLTVRRKLSSSSVSSSDSESGSRAAGAAEQQNHNSHDNEPPIDKPDGDGDTISDMLNTKFSASRDSNNQAQQNHNSHDNEPPNDKPDRDTISDMLNSKLRLFHELKDECEHMAPGLNVLYQASGEGMKFVRVDSETLKPLVTLLIRPNLDVEVLVLDKPLPFDAFCGFSKTVTAKSDIDLNLQYMRAIQLCPGNTDSKYHILSNHRSPNCRLLMNTEGGSSTLRCTMCTKHRYSLNTLLRRRTTKSTVTHSSSHKKPHSCMTNEELQLKLQHVIHENRMLQRKVKSLQKEVLQMKSKIESEIQDGIYLNHVDSDAFKSILYKQRESMLKTNDYQSLLWESQMKHLSLSDPRGMRWHPMIIKLCLYIKSKSASAYKVLRESGFLQLPSERTLFDYSHIVNGSVGIQDQTLTFLREETKSYTGHQFFVGLLQDEVKIKEDLVYDPTSGELIGFVNLGEFGNILETLSDTPQPCQFAKYVIVFMVRGITTGLKFPLCHYATSGITADVLYPLTWGAIWELEVEVGLKVLYVCCDGASPNRKFFQLHAGPNDAVIYSTDNIYAMEGARPLFFISDPPHLLKTVRNCFSNSEAHRRSRILWKNGKNISWQHIVDLYNQHCLQLYNRCPKLTRDHIYLNQYSIMKVKLAAQVLSNTVAQALRVTSGPETSETVEFISIMNRWFDIMNVKHLFEAGRTNNPDLAPFTSVDDPRLTWLRDNFLGYLEEWKNEVNGRAGPYSKLERSKMILSHQTLKGLDMTVRSTVEIIKFMISNGAPFVLTSHINQDPLEQYFGHLRQRGGANDNPNLYRVNLMMNQIRYMGLSRFGAIRGNVHGEINREVDNRPLQRRH